MNRSVIHLTNGFFKHFTSIFILPYKFLNYSSMNWSRFLEQLPRQMYFLNCNSHDLRQFTVMIVLMLPMGHCHSQAMQTRFIYFISSLPFWWQRFLQDWLLSDKNNWSLFLGGHLIPSWLQKSYKNKYSDSVQTLAHLFRTIVNNNIAQGMHGWCCSLSLLLRIFCGIQHIVHAKWYSFFSTDIKPNYRTSIMGPSDIVLHVIWYM